MHLETQQPKKSPVSDLRDIGYCILPSAFDRTEIAQMRKIVTANQDRMPNTRLAHHSRHLAGFERFPEFAELLPMIDQNGTLNDFFGHFFEGQDFASFGLSDITVNRSQQWHSDLLRRKYAVYLDGIDPWSDEAGACVKALVYLQAGKSLKVVPGSHKRETPLDDVQIERLVADENVDEVPVAAGDIVMMDIRCLHRGSTDQDMSNAELSNEPKILVSNVYAASSASLGTAMMRGNNERMKDWDLRHLSDGNLLSL